MEKEKLISPDRNANNGYREYSEEDIKTIKKVAYLRTLGISVEDIRRISSKETDLYDVVKTQRQSLDKQLSELENAKIMCERMLSSNPKIYFCISGCLCNDQICITLALSVETFIILYVNGIVKYVTVILFIDTFVLIGLLLMIAYRTTRKRRG